MRRSHYHATSSASSADFYLEAAVCAARTGGFDILVSLLGLSKSAWVSLLIDIASYYHLRPYSPLQRSPSALSACHPTSPRLQIFRTSTSSTRTISVLQVEGPATAANSPSPKGSPMLRPIELKFYQSRHQR